MTTLKSFFLLLFIILGARVYGITTFVNDTDGSLLFEGFIWSESAGEYQCSVMMLLGPGALVKSSNIDYLRVTKKDFSQAFLNFKDNKTYFLIFYKEKFYCSEKPTQENFLLEYY